MSEQAKHTPGVMRVGQLIAQSNGHCEWVGLYIGDNQLADVMGDDVSTTEADANAQRLALCWNCHADLLKAAKRALAVLKAQNGESIRPGNVLGALADAIAKAEVKS